MFQELLLLLANALITSNVVLLVAKSVGRKSKLLRRTLALALSCVVVYAHYAHFTAHKGDSYYDILGVGASAAPHEIKAAQQRLALQYHPDKAQTGDNEMFIKVKHIQKVMRDSERRSLYDRFGEMPEDLNEKEREAFFSGLRFKEYSTLSFFYAIALVVVIVMTYEESVRPARAPVTLLVLASAALDVLQKGDVAEDAASIVSAASAVVVPHLAPFEVSRLLRFLVGAYFTLFKALAGASDEFSLEVADKMLRRNVQAAEKALECVAKGADAGAVRESVAKIDLKRLQRVLVKNCDAAKRRETGASAKVKKIVQKFIPIFFGGLTLLSFAPIVMRAINRNE